MTPRIGLFGGTFDPIHQAHLRMARALRDELALDEVRLIPAGNPYHRAQGPHASAQQRLDMVRLAIEDEARLVADDREVKRRQPAYTVDTLREVRAELGEQAELWLLIGGDSLAALPSWKEWRALFELANIAVAVRPGLDWQALPAAVATEWNTRQVTDFSNRNSYGTMRALALPPLDLSATALRTRLAADEAVGETLTPAVRHYIRQHGLYR